MEIKLKTSIKRLASIKKYRERCPDKIRKLRYKTKLRLRYGLTPEQFEEMVSKQRGKCLGCGEEKKLCVDHCHVTGRVRGLLCRQCNSVIGLAKESIQILKNLVSYLEV